MWQLNERQSDFLKFRLRIMIGGYCRKTGKEGRLKLRINALSLHLLLTLPVRFEKNNGHSESVDMCCNRHYDNFAGVGSRPMGDGSQNNYALVRGANDV